MKCPTCKNILEGEDCGLVTSTTLKKYLKDGKPELKIVPAMHYYCTFCDSEWSWVRATKGSMVKIDGSGRSEL